MLTPRRNRPTPEYHINQVSQIKNIGYLAISINITFFWARTWIYATPEDEIYKESQIKDIGVIAITVYITSNA